MANKAPKKRDPEAARAQARAQWSDPEKRKRLLAGVRKAKVIEPPTNAAEIVQKACENGCTNDQIATALGIGRKLLNEWKERYPAIEEAFHLGRAVEHDALVNSLFVAATQKGNITAGIFLLKARHGYVEGVPLVQNSVSVNFTLPGAMTPEQWVKSLTVEAQLVQPEQARALASEPKLRKTLKNELYRHDAEAE
jgi:hypothetical protein